MAFLSENEELWQLVKSISEDEGFSLYDAELAGSKQLKISVDGKDGENPNIDNCSKILKRLMVTLHAEGADYGIGSDLEIDVSSPGVDRRLRRPDHFQAAIGKIVKIVCDKEVVAGGVVVGQLKSFADEVLTLSDCNVSGGESEGSNNKSSEDVSVKFSQIKKANLEFVF